MDLFSDSESISVVPSQERPLLSKAQKAFNTLIGKIEKQRALLAEWEATIPRFQQRHLAELTPLIEASTRLRRERVLGLERAHSLKSLHKAERRLIADLICEWAGELAAENDDAQMKALYNHYSGGDFDEEAAVGLSGMKAILESALDIELGDDVDLNDPEAFVRQMRERIQQEQATQAEREAARHAARRPRKKTAKQQAREDRLLEEEKRASQSLREIYRKLASALHPDREPDPGERARKTEMMQRVNQAYDRKDLLALLELQLQIEHIDQAALNALSEERLGHFNKLLREQLGELEERVLQVNDGILFNLGSDFYRRLTPVSLLRELDANIVRVRAYQRELEADLLAIQDVAGLKAWLKRYRRDRRSKWNDDFDNIPF